MKNKKICLVMLAVVFALVFGMSVVGCATTNEPVGDPTPTKFEGRWLNLVAVNDYGYSDMSYTFTGNIFVFKRVGNNDNLSLNGTFTFTDTKIKFTSRSRTWEQEYTLNDNVLFLEGTSNAPNFGPFTKQ